MRLVQGLNLIEPKVSELLESRNSLVVGINGLDCSGKTSLAKALFSSLENRGVDAGLLHVDDFNNQEFQSEFYRDFEIGKLSPPKFDEYYLNSIHYGGLADSIGEQRNRYRVLIVEGVFLFRDALANLFDLKIFLDVEYQLARARYLQRKLRDGDTRPIEVFDQIWIPAFERYCLECSPSEKSDIRLQN